MSQLDYYLKNKKKILEQQKKYYRKRKETDPAYNLQCRIWAKEAYLRDGAKKKEWQKKYYKENRRKLLDFLGGARCVKCGFDSNESAIQIDHINGVEPNDPIKNRKPHNILQYLQTFPDEVKKYQILCANCNKIKQVENNEYYTQNSEKKIKEKLVILEEELEIMLRNEKANKHKA